MLRFVGIAFVVLIGVLIGLGVPIGLLRAAPADSVVGNGTPGSCTESALTTALAGGGTITFNCGGPKTILVLSVKDITQNTLIDGGGVITLTGGLATRLFYVSSVGSLSLNNLTLDSAFNAGSGGGAIESLRPMTLTNVTIQNSLSNGGCGGAIWTNSTLVIDNSTFKNDAATYGGGAVCLGAINTTQATIADSNFFNNQATDPTLGYGGAIQVGNDAQLTLTGGDLSTNDAVLGGGIFVYSGASVNLTALGSPLFISSNSASDSGGAIYNDEGSMQISNANFTGNSAAPNVVLSGYGGAIANLGVMTITAAYFGQNQGRFGGAVFVGDNASGASAAIDHSTFYNNTATQLGGGLYTNIQTTTVAVTDSAFNGNSAAAGGGIARFNARLSIYDSSITQNTATSGGGGLLVDGGPTPGLGGYVEVHDSTLSTNTSTDNHGGGVYNADEVNLANVTIKDNTNGIYTTDLTRLHNSVLQNSGSLNCDGNGSVPSSAGGNFSTDNSCSLTGFHDQQGSGLDPKLGPLTLDTYNITFYHMPQAGSPLINAATPACSTRDQRHALRPDACDIGAVEYGGLLPQIYLPLVMK